MSPEDLQLQADEDLRNILATPSGRRWLWTLIDERASALSPTFAGEATHQSAYGEGKRSVGLQVMLDAQRVAAPDYVHMLSEALSRRSEQQLERDREKADGDGE